MSFSLMPFLYQTRTILRIPAHRASAGIARSLHATARRPGNDTIPFDYEIGPPDENSPAPEAPTGTITPTERRIFERIFADIEARGLKPAIKDDGTPVDTTPNRSARLIMQQAALDAGQARRATVTAPAVLSGTAQDRAKALLRFPPQLRPAAEKALDAIKQQARPAQYDDDYDIGAAIAGGESTGDEWEAPAHTFARTVELEAKRFPERTRIEGLITSAASDFELWDVLEKEVFTMPARLGIVKPDTPSDDADPPPPPKPKKRGRPSRAKLSDEPSQDTEPEPEVTEPEPEVTEPDTASASPDDVSDSDDSEKLSLYVHGPLYPAYLLLALRRLDIAFSAPSSLAFSVLPRIKELGLESYVLGVSTPLYNELLTIYWTRRGDLSGMLQLLEEMRHCGLYFDNKTTSILNHVDQALDALAIGKDRSGFGRALMLMPEYEQSQRDRLRFWHRQVDLSIQDRKRDLGYIEESSNPRMQ